jgi:UDP-4-amino-4,6-dideoxy-N-acetyl-beta-L-altrosamine transaminase
MSIDKFIPYAIQQITEDDIAAVTAAMRSPFLTTGPAVNKFEEKICEVTGAKYAVAVCNGTAALHLASLALLNPGDKVLTTPNSFVATANSIIYAGAGPVFTDISENGNIDFEQCEKILAADSQKSIKALYAVHFSGNPVDSKKLGEIKDKFGVKILEDCAHSLGADLNPDFNAAGSLDGKTHIEKTALKAGGCHNSDCSILSFHPVKHITTGEGGAVTTNSEEIYKKLLILRSHGIERSDFICREMAFDSKGNLNPWYYEMQTLGFNYRITDFQCALGVSQLGRLAEFVSRRRHIAQIYDGFFKNADFIKPLYLYNGRSSYHLYVVKIDFNKINLTRSEFMLKLKDKNIGSQLHYIPINKQPFYISLGYGKEENTVMKDYYDKCLSIPMYNSLSDGQAGYVAETILKLTQTKGK